MSSSFPSPSDASSIPAWRSLLFVPASDAALCAKACASEADAVILDLEDAVAADAKDAARANLAGAAEAAHQNGKGVVVRINAPTELARHDLDASVIAHVDALMFPKSESATDLVALDKDVAKLETERELRPGGVGVIALVETPLGLVELNAIAAAPRLIGLAFGPEDFCAALGVTPTPTALDVPARLLAIAAAARELVALSAPTSLANFKDIPAFNAGLRDAAAFGATGALCIHPAQVTAANTVFTPTETDVETADRKSVV